MNTKEFPDTLQKLDKSEFIKQHKDIDPDRNRKNIEEASLVIIFSAAAVGSSSILLLVPNLETMTLFIFLVSLLYRFRVGFSMMLTSSIIFELFASVVYGFAGIVFVFKFIAYTIVVMVGSSLNPILNSDMNKTASKKLFFGIVFSLLGFVFTIIFDLITSLSAYIILQNTDSFILFFITGIPFFIFHQLTNVVMFFFVPEYIHLLQLSEKKFIRN